MAAAQPVPAWSLPDPELTCLTPHKARDLIVDCFVDTQLQRATVANPGTAPDPAAVRRATLGAIRLCFQAVACDYQQPSKDGLRRVVEMLARKSSGWGVPPAVVQHHRRQISIVLARLPY